MCIQCEKKPVYEFTNKRRICSGCFVRYFQKKVLYAIRKFHMLKHSDVIGFQKSNDFRSVVLKDVLKFFSKKTGVEIITNLKKANKIAVSDTTDFEAEKIINKLFTGNLKDIKQKNNKIIQPLFLFLDEEVLLYAKIKKLKFTAKKIQKNNFLNFINDLEKKHPEIKRGILNSWLEIKD